MKRQILIIHGGNAFDTHDQFISDLKKREVYLDQFKTVDWKYNLGKDLGEEYEVLNPKMPNSQNAKYSEWKIWFERIAPHLEDSVILIGHSLGGIFLAKYLSENNFKKKIKAVILVAPPFNSPTKHPLADFILIRGLENFEKQAGKIIIFHSKDDSVVPFSNAKSYVKVLKSAELLSFEKMGHFNQENFPEIEKVIKSL